MTTIPKLNTTIFILIIISIMISFDNSWGFLEAYVASYLRLFNQNITITFVHVLYTISMAIQVLGAFLFRPICLKYGYREGLAICFFLVTIGLIIQYLSTSIYPLFITMALFGIAVSVRTLINGFLMMCLMPENPGFASGLGNTGGPLGPIYWSHASLAMQNPENKPPAILVMEGEREAYYFDEEIAMNCQRFYVFQAFVMFLLGVLLPPLVINPKGKFSQYSVWWQKFYVEKENKKTQPLLEQETETEIQQKSLDKTKEQENQGQLSKIELSNISDKESEQELHKRFKHKLFSIEFILLFQMLSFSVATSLIFIINIKAFGLSNFSDAAISHLSYMSCSLSVTMRFGAGYLVDKFGIVVIYRLQTIVNITTVVLFYLYQDNLAFFYYTISMFYVTKVSFATFIGSVTVIVYGFDLGMKLQSVMHCTFAMAGIMAWILDAFVLNALGIGFQCMYLVIVNLIIFIVVAKYFN